MPFLKNCLGSLLARPIQLLDPTDGLVKATRYVAVALRLDPFEILMHAYWWKTVRCVNMHTIDVIVQCTGLSLGFPKAILMCMCRFHGWILGFLAVSSDNHSGLPCNPTSCCSGLSCWNLTWSPLRLLCRKELDLPDLSSVVIKSHTI